MNRAERQIAELETEWRNIDLKLEELAAGKVGTDLDDVQASEQRLLRRLDEIEYELGILRMNRDQ